MVEVVNPISKNITSFLLEETSKQELESIANFEGVSISDILRSLVRLFLNDYYLQRAVLKEAKMR